MCLAEMMEEPDELTEGAEEAARPLGLRVALAFLRVFALIMLVPLAGAFGIAMAAAVRGSVERNPTPETFIVSALSLAGFLMTMATWLALLWLDGHLTGQWSQRRFLQKAVNPGRLMGLLSLGCVGFQSFLAVLIWSAAAVVNGLQGIAWPLLWGSVGIAAVILYLYLEKRLAP
jgi:hypothetical protein